MRIVSLLGLILGTFFSSNLGLPAGPPDPSAVEKAVHAKINAYRLENGLDRLRWDERLAEQARSHSRRMARREVPFGHSGFRERVRATGVKFSASAENVGENQGYDDPVAQAVEGWLNSKGHRENIEGRYNLTGVGVARTRDGTFYFTQIFMLTRPE